MIKVEKMDAGYVVEMDGSDEELVHEIANAAAVYHVRAIKEFMQVHADVDVKHAIEASVDLFGLLMIQAMEKQLGVKEDGEKREPVSIHEVISFDETKKKGGALQ